MGNLHGADAPQWNGLRLIAFRDCSIHSPGHLYPTSECRACAQGSDLECDCTLHDEPQIKSSPQCTPALIQMRRKGYIGRESLTCPSPYALPNNRTRSSSWGGMQRVALLHPPLRNGLFREQAHRFCSATVARPVVPAGTRAAIRECTNNGMKLGLCDRSAHAPGHLYRTRVESCIEEPRVNGREL